jgi:hypothetical protein
MRNSPYGITVPFRANATINKFRILSEDLEHTQVISHDNHALGTAHAFAHVTAKTDLESVHQLGASAQRPRWLR